MITVRLVGIMKDEPVIPLPLISELSELAQVYIEELRERPRYVKEGEAIEWFFTIFGNTDINEVLIKIMALDSSYSTNVRDYSSIHKLAEIIVTMPYFVERLKKRDVSLVDDICNSDRWKDSEEKSGKPFSFATKYCCNHNSEYPIYDSFVAKVLTYYQEEDDFLGTKEKTTPDILSESYENMYFPRIKKFHDLLTTQGGKVISYRDLDHFLWRMGQEFFLGYKIAKVGDYIIQIEGKTKFKTTIFIKDKNIDLKKHIIPILKKKKQNIVPKVKEKKYDLALRILKKLYVCVLRKEGIVGHFYIDATNKTIDIYKMYDYTNNSGDETETGKNESKNVNENENRLAKTLRDIVNNPQKSKYGYPFGIGEMSLQETCKEIVEKYDKVLKKDMMKKAEERQKDKEKFLSIIRKILDDTIDRDSLRLISCYDRFDIYLKSNDGLYVCQLKDIYSKNMIFVFVDEKGKLRKEIISSFEDIKKYSGEIITRAKTLCEAKEHDVSNEKQQESVKQSGVNKVKTSDIPISKEKRQNKMKTQTRIPNKKQ